jgi:hypothetical protein
VAGVVRRTVVDWAIVDEGCVVEAGAVVGRPDADATGDPDQVTIVGTGEPGRRGGRGRGPAGAPGTT